MKSEKTVFIIVDQGFSTRYLLRSEIFQVLKNSGHRIVILAPNPDEEYFQKEFQINNVFMEKYEIEKYSEYQRKSVIQKLLKKARLFAYNRRHYVNCSHYWYNHYKTKRKGNTFFHKIYYLSLDLLVWLLIRSKFLRKLECWSEGFFIPKVHVHLFKKYNPALLVVASFGNLSFDHYIMWEARQNRTKIISVILSWDNPTTKGLAGATADHIITWTETMKEELVAHHDINPEKIFVGGVALYDLYHSPEQLLSKAEIFKFFSLSPNRKLIFFCLMSPTQFNWNKELIEILGQLVAKDAFSEPCQMLIRLHPIYFRIVDSKYRFQQDIDQLMAIKDKYANVHYDVPEVLSQKMSYDMPQTEAVKLGSLMRSTDVLLCFFSSMMLEGSIFDRPVINIALFDQNDIPNQVVMQHNHIKRILETDGVSNVFNKDELVSTISAYFEDHTLNAPGRKQIVENETGPNRGQAGKAIGNHIVEILNGI